MSSTVSCYTIVFLTVLFITLLPTSSLCSVFSSLTYLLVFIAPFRTMQRLTPPSCGAKLTLHAWKASGRVQCTLYRCGHGLWLALANTAARCASKPSQMVRIAEPGETALCRSLSFSVSLSLSHTHTYTPNSF